MGWRDLDALAVSMRWRIARQGGGSELKLVGLEIAPGSSSEAQLTTESEVDPLRLSTIKTQKTFNRARPFLSVTGETTLESTR